MECFTGSRYEDDVRISAVFSILLLICCCQFLQQHQSISKLQKIDVW